jgi:DNA-binding transcriptional MerR regulator
MYDLDRTNRTYSTYEIAEMSGFSIRQVGYWAKQGIVIPSIQQAHGSGTRRCYSLDDLLQLRFIRQLKNHGWSTQKIREAIIKLREIMDDPQILQRAILIPSARTILAICKTQDGERILLDCLDSGGQQVMWIYLWTLQEEALLATANSKEKVKLTSIE